jgi:hypothetical protein
MHCRAVDVKEADRVAFELLSLGFIALDFRQAREAMPLQAAVQRRAREARDGGLKGIETIIQWQQRVTPKSDDHRLFRFGQDRRARLSWASFEILDRRPLTPLRHRLGVDPELPA